MEIGKPKRVVRVEPLRDPVPSRRRPEQEPPQRVEKEPRTVPAR
jgi:hypothetical protein